ncbi:hypothetical protein OOZ19_11920 [Saccharopolyspora sp. NFXS83]|uniref:hypothetical protein n=1 Tax=Saccharopolyspora sp. NFXS83 TaxID=2993560 RepID=UPI00224B58B0|nr:hypothetical protein [Saccharopolyspora sp. NFXS83]MCX2730950.1 hypothetical protein [Saccharopolyspora sp. NFXS83]
MRSVPPALLSPAGLVAGFAVTRLQRHRSWSGLVAGAGGLAAMESCRRRSGGGRALVLGAAYAGALAGSHPLARRIGAWPAVFTAAGGVAVAARVLAQGGTAPTG